MNAILSAAELEQMGIVVSNPSTVFISPKCIIGKNVKIHNFVTINDETIIEDGCEILAYCYLNKAKLGQNCIIKPFTTIEDSEVYKDCQIGPYARIRDNSIIREKSSIGNFVEIARSSIGVRNRVNHHSFIGDTISGADVTLGAGTITSNFDGKERHVTTIKDNVFVGCNVSIIAPINIAENATIGAGATIKNYVEPGGLTISKTKQLHYADWNKR